MHGYGVALYVHLLALLSATAASALVHLAAARAARAGSAHEALEWHRFAGKAARVFPLAVLTLVATGSYMVGGAHGWGWGLGWVRAGLLGSVLLLAQGAVIGARGKRVAAALAAGRRAGDPLAARLGSANTAMALAIVFVMAAKPGLAGALTAVLGAAALGALLGGGKRRAGEPAVETRLAA